MLSVVREEKKLQFKLEHEPIMFAMSIHFNNLFAYFHPYNMSIRNEMDKNVSITPSDIIKTIEFLLVNKDFLDEHLTMRYATPMEFRCSQIIQYYGAAKVQAWLNLFYGKEKVG
jgi:hypothetical protein